jgi:hypothetical protein
VSLCSDPEVLTRQLVRLEAQCRLLEEEVLTKDAGLRALHQSLLSVTATSLLQQGRHEDATEVRLLQLCWTPLVVLQLIHISFALSVAS